MILKAGSIITCPTCEMPQLKSTKDLLPGGKMGDAQWESLGYELTAQFMNCFKCGTLWARRHPKTRQPQIHTQEDGWVTTQKEDPATTHPPPKLIM